MAKRKEATNNEEKVLDQHGYDTGLVLSNFDGDVETMTEAQREAEEKRLQAIDKVSKKAIEDAKVATTRYWDAETIGDSIRGIYKGFRVLQVEDEHQPGTKKPIGAVLIKTSNGVYMAAGVHLVEPFLGGQIPQESAVHITYQGKKNRMKLFEVRLLEV